MPPDPSAAASSSKAAAAASGQPYRERVFWTPEEDALLLKLVAIHGSKRGKDSKWPIVAAALEGRNIKDCRKRYFHSLAPDLKKGRWSKEEDALLLKGLDELGPIWYKIAQMIPGRKDDQCAKRWKEVLDPSLSKGKAWSKDEDDLLLGLFETNGPKWQHIAKSIPGRTGLCCRNRWRKFKGDEKVHGALLDLEERQRKTGGNAGGTRSHPQGGRGRRSVSESGGRTGNGDDDDDDGDDGEMDIDGDTPSSMGVNGQTPASHYGDMPTPYGTAPAHLFHSPAAGSGGAFDFLRPLHAHDGVGGALDPPGSSRSPHHPALQNLVQQSNALGGSGQQQQQQQQGGRGLAPSYADHFSNGSGGLPSLAGPQQGSLFGGPASMLAGGGQDHAGMLFSQDLGARLSAVEHARNGSGSSQGGGGLGSNGVGGKHGLFNLVHPDSSAVNGVGPAPGGGGLHRDNPHDPIARLLAEGDGGTPSSLASASSLGSSPAFPTGSSPSGISPSSLSNESFATPASDHHHAQAPAAGGSGTNGGGGNGFHPGSAPNGVGGGGVNGGHHLGGAGGAAGGSHKPPSHHVHFPDHPHEELDHNDNPTWVTSFLASLHHPSASLPPTALNSPVFTGAWDAGLFSAPPSPQKHLFMHLPPMLDHDDLPPLPPPAVGAPPAGGLDPAPAQTLGSKSSLLGQQQQQQQQPQSQLQQQQQQYLRSPNQQQQQQQVNALQQSLHHQRSPYPPPTAQALPGFTPSPSSAPAAGAPSSSFNRPMPQLASPRRERSPLHPPAPTAPSNGTGPSSASSSAGAMAPPPLPAHTQQAAAAAHQQSAHAHAIQQHANANGQVPHAAAAAGTTAGGPVQPLAMPLPYLTWDPRPPEEQTNAVPMVLVPMSILAGLIERASMVDAHGNPTGKQAHAHLPAQAHMR